MVRTHSEAVEGEPPVNAESAAASGPNDLAKPNKKKKKNKPDKEIAAEREQTWPAEMERMVRVSPQLSTECFTRLTIMQTTA